MSDEHRTLVSVGELDNAIARLHRADGDELQEKRQILRDLLQPLEAKLELCQRLAEMEGADGDCAFLANDFGGTTWPDDPACKAVGTLQQLIYKEKVRADAAHNELAQVEVALINTGEFHGDGPGTCGDRLVAAIKAIDEDRKNGSDWYNAFEDVSNWMLARDLWEEGDIHPTEPAKTLIAGLARLFARANAHRTRGCVVWLTGLSGAGKTTLANGLKRRLDQAGVLSTVLDGDAVRAVLCWDLKFSDEDRKTNVFRVGEVACLMAKAGLVTVVALISPFADARRGVAMRCREVGIQFIEVYVNTPLAECERRDPKGLYRRARAGQIPAFTGIDSPYEVPPSPMLELHPDTEGVDETVNRLFEFVHPLTAV